LIHASTAKSISTIKCPLLASSLRRYVNLAPFGNACGMDGPSVDDLILILAEFVSVILIC